MAEAEDLKSSQCGFDPHSGHLVGALFSGAQLIYRPGLTDSR